MSEIPDDIMQKARETWHDVMGFHNDRGGFVGVIARAIMEERVRCENAVLLAGLEAPIPETLLAAIRNRP